MSAKPDTGGALARVRMDKWLWAARFYKTRSLAAVAIEAGQARLARSASSPRRPSGPVTTSCCVAPVCVEYPRIALSEKRGGAADAAKLYSETTESIAARGWKQRGARHRLSDRPD